MTHCPNEFVTLAKILVDSTGMFFFVTNIVHILECVDLGSINAYIVTSKREKVRTITSRAEISTLARISS